MLQLGRFSDDVFLLAMKATTLSAGIHEDEFFLQRFFSRKRNPTTGRRQAKQKHVALCCGVKECDLTVRELNLCFGCFCPVTVF